MGSNHFDEYNIRIDPQGKAVITSVHSQTPRETKDILDLFIQNQSSSLHAKKVRAKQTLENLGKPTGKAQGPSDTRPRSPKKHTIYKTLNHRVEGLQNLSSSVSP